jgi:hypothetical protein
MNPLQHLSRTRQVSPRDEASPTARQRQSGSPVAQTHAEGKIKAAKGLLGSKTIMLVICGLVVLGGVAYLWHTTRRSQEQEDERRRRRLELRSQALPQLPPNVGFPGAEQTQQQAQVQQQAQAQAQQAQAQAQAQQAQAQQAQAQAQQVQAQQQAQAQQVQAQSQQVQAQQQAQAHALEQQLVYANEGNGNTVLPQLSSMQDLIEKTRRISLQCSSLHTIYGKARQLVPLCGQPLLDDLAQTKRAQPVEDKPIASTAPSPASEAEAQAQAQAQAAAQAQAEALAQAQAQAQAEALAQAQAAAQAQAQAQAAALAQAQAQAAAQALLDQRAFAAQMESNRAQELARQQALEAEISRAQAAAQAAQIEVNQLHRDAQDKVAAATAAPEDPAPAPVTDLVVVDEEVKPTRPKRARAKKRPNDSMVL